MYAPLLISTKVSLFKNVIFRMSFIPPLPNPEEDDINLGLKNLIYNVKVYEVI